MLLNDNIFVAFGLILLLFMIQVKGNEAVTHSFPQSQDHQCPPWFFYNTATQTCECFRSSSTENIVECTEQGALLRYGNCMTYEEGIGTFVGRCQSFEIDGHNISESFPGFITLPDNVSELNDYMCGPMNRKGLVCSECVEGFGPSVTSFGFSCSNCTDAWYGIVVYLILEFVPITVFYLIILIFRVGLTSSPFTAFVLFSQFAVTAVSAAFGPYSFEASPVLYYFSVVISFYGIWNLDFFRYLIPPFCVSSRFGIIHIVYLGYISAFYPLLLIGITWVCIELHSRNFKAFVWTWKKLDSFLLKHVKRESKSTIIDVFSTFLLLSYTKIVGIFVDTIEPDFVLNMNNLPTRRVLLVDPSIEWLGNENLPYVFVSVLLFLVLIFPPVALLTFYPVKLFRSLLLKCSSSGHIRAAFNIFVEKFYDSYRDGLDGGKDMRALAALYFILRIFVYLISIAERYLLYNAILIGGTAIFIAIIQPYKKAYMNIIDTLLLATLSFSLIMLDLYFRESLGSTAALFYALNIGLVGSFPMWGFLGYIVYKIIPFNRLQLWMKKSFPSCVKLSICCHKKKIENEGSASDQGRVGSQAEMSVADLDLPDRMVNPENYNGQLTYTA